MSTIQEYIEALRNGKGYTFICDKGNELSKTELMDIVKEFDYMVHQLNTNKRITQLHFDIVADELESLYCE